MRLLLIVAMLAAPAAAHAAPAPALLATLASFVHALNAPNDAEFTGLFGRDPSITDTLYPYHWQGAEAPKHYFADLQAQVKAIGWTDLKLAKDGEAFVVARPEYAYASLPLFVSYKAHGASHRDKGFFTLSLHQEGSAWRINSATWTYSEAPGR